MLNNYSIMLFHIDQVKYYYKKSDKCIQFMQIRMIICKTFSLQQNLIK